MDGHRILERTLIDLLKFTEQPGSVNTQKMFVAFDFDNTLKVLGRGFRRTLREGASEVLEKLSNCDNVKLVLITAISPSRTNLDTLFIELDDLGLSKYFVEGKCEVDGHVDGKRDVVFGEGWMAHENIIMSPNKPDALLEYYGLKDKTHFPAIHFVDDEENNIYGFKEAIPSSECYLVK